MRDWLNWVDCVKSAACCSGRLNRGGRKGPISCYVAMPISFLMWVRLNLFWYDVRVRAPLVLLHMRHCSHCASLPWRRKGERTRCNVTNVRLQTQCNATSFDSNSRVTSYSKFLLITSYKLILGSNMRGFVSIAHSI